MEQLYEYDVTLLFLKIANEMVNRCGIKIGNAHIDGTSLSVYGKYLKAEEIEENPPEIEEDEEPVLIKITHGYSRDHRPDLKQFTLSLLTVAEEGIPLFMQLGNGNELDQKAFPKILKNFRLNGKENSQMPM